MTSGFSMRSLEVKILKEFEGRPRREDVYVEDWEGPLISPSALSSFLACPRKWAFGALEGQYRPSTASQELGTQLHAQLEYWLTNKQPPLGRLTDSGALSLVPLPTTPGLECEQPFTIEVSKGDRRAVLWGFRDIAAPGVVMDLKSTSSLKWAKTPDDLIHDPQANIYAAACMLESGFDYADLRWVYVTTKGAVESKGVDVRLTRDQVTAKLADWFDIVDYMTILRTEKTKKALELDPRRTACGSYGGCDFLPQCGDYEEEEAGSGFLSLIKRKKGKERELDMGIMDKVRKDLGDWKTDELAANVKNVPVRETAAATTPVVKKTSKSSLLSKVKKEAKAAPVSTGINAPDAKPAKTETAAPEAAAPETAAPEAAAPETAAPEAAAPEAVEAAPTKKKTTKKKAAAKKEVEAGSLQAALQTSIVVFVDCAPYKLADASAQALFISDSNAMKEGNLYCVNSAHVSAEVLERITDYADIVIRG